MDLILFPFDSQVCKLGIESCTFVLFILIRSNSLDGYTADEVRYKWSPNDSNPYKSLKLHPIRLPDFQLKEAYVTSAMENYATGIVFVCIMYIFCFRVI
jgi:hypothetical protein